MPKPEAGEKKDDFIKRCIPIVIEDGTAKDGNQAVAVCMNLWEKGSEEVKKIDDGLLIAFGGTIKALGSNKFGGYLISFSDANTPDLSDAQDFFDKTTDFDREFPSKQSLYFNHGLDKKFDVRRLSKADLDIDEYGIWAETILQERDEYERFLVMLAKAGKLGLSSGSMPDLVRRTRTGKSNHIDYWPIADASLTHVPADYHNHISTLKSLQSILSNHDSTMAERILQLGSDMNLLSNDLQAFVKKIDRPLSETKRKELTELLESCSGMDAVRSDLQSVLTSAPIPRLVEPKLVSHKLAETRKRLCEKQVIQE